MYEGRLVSDLIADTLEGLRQPPANYNRYSKASILNALNLSNIEIAERTKCLHGWGIIVLRSGYAQYLPPSDMLTPKDAYFFQSADSYVHLTKDGFKSREWLNQYQTGWRTMSGDPVYTFMGDNAGNSRKIGFSPTPDTNGTNYLSSPDTGVVISTGGMTTTGNITGTNSAAHATICTDTAGRTLSTSGVSVGMVALNVTDGSKGQISAVSTTTFTAALTGGTSNTWGLNASFAVLAGEYGICTNISGDEKYVFSTDAAGLILINALVNVVYLEYYRKPITLVYDTQYPETPRELHRYLPEFAIWWLKRRSTPGSNDLNEAVIAKTAFDEKVPQVRFVPVDRVVEPSIIKFNW